MAHGNKSLRIASHHREMMLVCPPSREASIFAKAMARQESYDVTRRRGEQRF
jgi:hypothetical protein